MSTHGINMDAIQAGVEAFLETYPDEAALDARSPTAAPKGAHAVLWMDDWWRGVDMAREALLAGDFRPESVRNFPGKTRNTVSTKLLRRVACAAAAYSLANEGRSLDYQVALCSLDGRLELDDVDIDPDAVDVFVCQIGSLIVNGDADWHSKTDPETVADRAEPG